MAGQLIETHVSAIKELRDQLEEYKLSNIECQGFDVYFTVSPIGPAGGQNFVLRLQPQYPSAAGTLAFAGEPNGNEAVNLDHINDIIARGCTVGSALAQLGKALKIDLGWAQEAVVVENEREVIVISDDDEIFVSDDYHGGIQEVLDWSEQYEELVKIEKQTVRMECSMKPSEMVPPQMDPMRKREAAFKLLVNEFREFYMSTDSDLLVEQCGGIFHWRVIMGGFQPQSLLDSDLIQLGETKGVSVVDFEIIFESLYPDYPPCVRLISPRFKNRVLELVVSHPLLQRRNWNVQWKAKNVINLVRQILQMKGRIEFDARDQHYLEVEYLLARLHSLTGCPCLKQSTDPVHVHPEEFKIHRGPDIHAVDLGEKIDKEEIQASKRLKAHNGNHDKKDKLVWGAGTGYGDGDGDGYGGDDYYIMNTYKDKFKDLIVELSGEINIRQDTLNAWMKDLETDLLLDIIEKLTKEIAHQFSGEESNQNRRPMIYSALEDSCLLPYLHQFLSATSISDLFAGARQVKLSKAVVCCIQSLLKVMPILWTPIKRQDGFELSETIVNKFLGLSKHMSTYLCVILHSSDVAPPLTAQEQEEEQAVAELFLKVANEISSFDKELGSSDDKNTENGDGTNEEALYVSKLTPYKLQIMPGIAANHHYLQQSKDEPHQSTFKRAKKVAAHLVDLESYLPVNTSSSIFVVADEQQTILWKAIIIGPKDTPYEGGAFLFDIYFDYNYPKEPPKVNFRTTGRGSVRFNPNLYEGGKVCLSLLKTWRGGAGEVWTSDVSTVMQVLTSIQALIFVEQPYYNEPGYARDSAD